MMDDAIENLIQEIRCFQTNETSQTEQDGGEFVLVHKDAARFWSKVFIKHFLFDYHGSNARLGDDLLFFVRKQPNRRNMMLMRPLNPNVQQFTTKIDVFRANSKQLPLKELDVDWEETLHLNLIMQKFEYTLVVAICTRTAAEQVEILNKICIPVYPSPSKRSMDGKGEQEQITYPDIYFSIDSYDQLYQQVEVHDGEWMSIELVYKCMGSREQIPLFQCHLDYSTFAQICSLNTNTNPTLGMNVSFFRARGSHRRGVCEMAIFQEPDEPDPLTLASGRTRSTLSLNDYEWDTSIATMQQPNRADTKKTSDSCCTFCPKCTTGRRRMSEPSLTLTDMIAGWKQRRVRKSKSDGQGKSFVSQDVIETCDLKEELDRDTNKSEWAMPGFTQVFFDQKQMRKYINPAFQCFPTYISLDWQLIAQQLITPSNRSYLLF